MSRSQHPAESLYSHNTLPCLGSETQQPTCNVNWQFEPAYILVLACRLDIDVQLVTEHKGEFDDVRVRAALFQIDEAHPNGYSEVMPAVDVEVKDKDHWISLDANTKRTHAECGTGGLALVRRQQHCFIVLPQESQNAAVGALFECDGGKACSRQHIQESAILGT